LARNFIIKDHPDLIIAVVNAATLDRSLYLVAELLLLNVPIVVALNMIDVAQQEGIQVEPKVLEAALGIPVIPMIASHGRGLNELKHTLVQMLNHQVRYEPKTPSILPAHKAILDELLKIIDPYIPEGYPHDWVALKLLEGDEELTAIMKKAMPGDNWELVHDILYQHEDAILDIAGARYEWVARINRAAVVQPKVSRSDLTSRLDKILTHPWWDIDTRFNARDCISIDIPNWRSDSNLVERTDIKLGRRITEYLDRRSEMAGRIFAGGVLGGLGMVLTFLPILLVFFTFLGLMEDTGYMARAAYLSDRWMHMIGLHGKSFMPILLGFGCNVPAVMGTRIIESKRARILTILLIPLVPCTARLAVITVLSSVFFGANAFWITWTLMAFNMLLLIGLGFLMHHFIFGNEHVPFIMELPLYHTPNLRTISIYVWQNIVSFLKKAGTTILVATLIVWALAYFPNGEIETSWLGTIGKFIAPVGEWMGLPWGMLVALLTSFVAKENTIATLGVLYGSPEALRTEISPAAGLAFLVFQLLFIPCIGTVAAIRQETRSWKWTFMSIGMQLILSLGLAVVVYQIGRLF